ncbi:MAG: SGNH/GDSL hydrolase family protein [Candidatus Levybacteria bacterium]|nr:SGNH/GDSL hydrolase family protein [Candidatus Levybacteria bacterium]
MVYSTYIYKVIFIIITVLLLLFLFVPLFVAFNWGKVPPFTNPSSEVKTFGNGDTTYRYVVMGDSTAAGQGADYKKGIAVTTAKHLAKKGTVAMQNFSISGATVSDVLAVQLPQALKTKPDVVLLSVGANDVNHVTSLSSLERDLDMLVGKLLANNCEMKIVLTGSPDMGTVKRFIPPLSNLATWQSKRVNTIFKTTVQKQQLTYAPIFEKVGPIFKKDQSLYASDNFHPNNRGYAVWNTVLEKALDESLKQQPSHCVKD